MSILSIKNNRVYCSISESALYWAISYISIYWNLINIINANPFLVIMAKSTKPTNVSLPIGLKERAISLGVNCSFEATKAIQRAVQIREEADKAPASVAKQNTGTTAPVKGAT